MARFSDYPIQNPGPDEVYFDFFPAKFVTKYLEDYVDNHVYAGKSLRERIEFNTTVQSVRQNRDTGLWMASTDKPSILSTPKLMICAGLTSIPNMPSLPGQDSFTGRIMHHRDFGSSPILVDPEVKHIAILGGAKSAADLAYAAATAGKQVSWIIRWRGCGPGGLLPAKGMGPYKNTNEVLYTRLAAVLNPSMWAPQNWTTRVLHQSRIGRRLVNRIWKNLKASARREAGFKDSYRYDDSSYQNLQPDTSIFWGNDSSGVNQRPDFWSIMTGDNIEFFRENITKISGNTIVMPFDAVCPDVIICTTGWQPSYHKFLDQDLAGSLGLPVTLPEPPRRSANVADHVKWFELEQAADDEICRRFPRLQEPPLHHRSTTTQSPFRLYKYMAPTDPKMRGIIFLGHIVIGNNFRAAECQALWAVAYLDGQLSLPSKEDMEREVAMSIAWCRRRYLSKGALGHWLYFDLVPYTDALLQQLGLESHRKKGRAKDFIAPCVAEDLKDLKASSS
jgi:dimethylaniline monooxygenase (N-oxide forming)